MGILRKSELHLGDDFQWRGHTGRGARHGLLHVEKEGHHCDFFQSVAWDVWACREVGVEQADNSLLCEALKLGVGDKARCRVVVSGGEVFGRHRGRLRGCCCHSHLGLFALLSSDMPTIEGGPWNRRGV